MRGKKRTKDWKQVEECKKYPLPERIPIYINGDKDIQCKYVQIRKDGRKSGITLFYCKNKLKIKNNEMGRLILGCNNCQEKNT